MSNPNIETYRGRLPSCRSCGKPLRPQYESETEGVWQATGERIVYLPDDEQYTPPDDPAVRAEGEDHLGAIWWSPKKRRWYRKVRVHRVTARKFLGTFGVRGNGFFCCVECGFRWAVRQLRKGDGG